MSVYTVPALNAVDFALTAHTVPSLASPAQALQSYTVPALSAVDFALVSYTAPTYMDIGWELLPSLSFPTQFFGLRVYDNGAVQDLCLVATADANSGNQLRLRKGSTTYAVYLVDTSDGNASTVRIRTSAGTKAIRLKT